MNLFPVFWILFLMWQQTVLIAHKNSEKYLKHKLVFHMMSYSQEPSQTSDTTKPEKETNFWHEISEKKDTFFSQLKTKFSNQERRGQKAASNIFNSYDFFFYDYFQVFIPAVHVYSNAINQSSQKRKVPQKAYLRKSSCPEIRAGSSHTKEEMFRNSSLPNFSSSSNVSQMPRFNSNIENQTRNLRKLQSVEEEKEGN